MFADGQTGASLAVTDIARARAFYADTLGFPIARESEGGILFQGGSSSAFFVYPSEFAGTNKATAASWAAGEDFDAIVADLQSKGVAFEHYDDLPETTREGDVHVMGGGFKTVWFKDPDGNILSLSNMSP